MAWASRKAPPACAVGLAFALDDAALRSAAVTAASSLLRLFARRRRAFRRLNPHRHAGSPPAYWGAAAIPHAPRHPCSARRAASKGQSPAPGHLAQRPAAARRQPHRLKLEFLRVLAPRRPHQTPSCSFRSLPEGVHYFEGGPAVCDATSADGNRTDRTIVSPTASQEWTTSGPKAT